MWVVIYAFLDSAKNQTLHRVPFLFCLLVPAKAISLRLYLGRPTWPFCYKENFRKSRNWTAQFLPVLCQI